MEKSKKNKGGSKGSNLFAGLVIVLCFVVGIVIWSKVMGNPVNFEGGDPDKGSPLPGNFLGVIYKGGPIVPVLMGLFLMTIVFSIERFIVISRAAGKGNLDKFVNKLQGFIAAGNTEEAIAACDEQKGSVGNVLHAALVRKKQIEEDGIDAKEATEAIQKEIEEAITLEMPMLEKNMTILSTLVSIGTLVGLLGTVSGMIKAFAGLATSGTPDQAQLANGISEALINTAIGIATSTLATIVYNYFTSKIDTLTYFIDEAGFAINQSYKRLKGNN